MTLGMSHNINKYLVEIINKMQFTTIGLLVIRYPGPQVLEYRILIVEFRVGMLFAVRV
jgi:hypothetical protein